MILNNDPLTLICCVLATYRLAQLIATENGPLDVFARVRRFFGKNASRNYVCKSIASGLNCVYCVGVWAAIFMFALASIHHWITGAILLWLAIAGGQAFLQDAVRRD